MKKKILFFLLLVGLGGVSVFSQELFYLRFYTNTGGNINNNARYLRSTGSNVEFVTSQSANARWIFEPVGGSEPGWYYIKHNASGGYLQAPASSSMGGQNQYFNVAENINTTQPFRCKFRLIKTSSSATVNNPTQRRFKIAVTNGTNDYVLQYRNSNLRSNVAFTADDALIELIPVETDWVFNSDQELVSTYEEISPSSGSWPAQPPITNCHDFSGYNNGNVSDTGETCFTGTPYTNLFPIGYTRSVDTTRVIHSNYASGNTEGDGLYFSRMAQNNTLTTQFYNTSIPAGEMLVISFWVRAASKTQGTSAMYDELKSEDSDVSYNRIMNALGVTTPPSRTDLQIPDGYVVGKMTASSTTGGNIGVIPITVPDIKTVLNVPDEWFFFRMYYKLPSATGQQISTVFTNLMTATDGLLDIDNISVSQIKFIDDPGAGSFKFNYKNGDKQSVHERTQVIYAMPGSFGYPDLLSAATQNYAYYRWHINEGLTKDEYIDYFIPESETRMHAGYAGVVYTSQTWNGTTLSSDAKVSVGTNGYRMNIATPDWGTTGKWEGVDNNEFIVSVDASDYNDYSWDATNGFTEPSLSWRNNFEFLPAWEIAAEMNSAFDKTIDSGDPDSRVLEYYELEAPINHRLRLTPKYTPTNYWITSTPDKKTYADIENADGTYDLVRAQRFYWVAVGADGTGNPTVAANVNTTGRYNNRITPSTSRYFPRQTSGVDQNYQQYMQVNTTGKTHNQVEYYDVYVNSAINASAIDRKIARFKVTYKSKDEVGPILPDGDLLDRVQRKKLITKMDFDQNGPVPTDWKTGPGRYKPLVLGEDNIGTGAVQPFSLGGFGVFRLGSSETSYGFMDPRFHTYTSSDSIPDGNGYHINADCGYWSEYSFPVAINHGITSGTATGISRGWSTSANVYDRTSYNTGGTTTTPGSTLGNMMYVDASQIPGIFATLDVKESVCPGTVLYFSTWIVNLNSGSAATGPYETGSSTNYTNPVTTVRPNLVFILRDLNDPEQKEIKRFYTGDIGEGGNGQWRQVAFEFTIPDSYIGQGGAENPDEVNFRLEIQNNGLGTTGNDFALDEICIYRTNPTVVATRVNATYCAPDLPAVIDENTELVVDETPLDMQVDVDIDNLKVYRTYNDSNESTGSTENSILYFRFLDSEGISFAGDYKGFTSENGYTTNYGTSENPDYDPGKGSGFDIGTDIKYPMYHGMGLETTQGYYYYGSVDLDDLLYKETIGSDKVYEKTYSYIVGEAPNDETYTRTIRLKGTILTFHQDIPYSILFDGSNSSGEPQFNHGPYSIYVAESSGALLTPSCAGEASFNVKFDETSFTAYVGASTEGMAPGELTVCTNQAVTIAANAKNVNTGDDMIAYFDWFYGPVNTFPDEALQYTYSVLKTKRNSKDGPLHYTVDGINYDIYKEGDVYTDGTNTYLESELQKETRAIETQDGFDQWIANSTEEQTWITTEEGQEWSWAPVNYVGYNQTSGFVSYPSRNNGDVDGTTSATMLAHDDFNNFDNRFIEWRRIKEDLKAFRYYFPYAQSVPEKDLTCFPVNPDKIEAVGSAYHYDYDTGEIYANTDASNTTPISVCDPALDLYRFTSADSYGTYTNREGKNVNRKLEEVQTPIPYISLTAEGEPIYGLAVNNLFDLNNLLSRIRYSEKAKILYLHANKMEVYVETLASYYLTAIPIGFAKPDLVGSTWENDRVQICATPALVQLNASDWGADAWFGETNDDGEPTMPYLEIDDKDFMYTVRLPEKDVEGNYTTTQFITPLLYFDEVKAARVRLLSVTDKDGNLAYTAPTTENDLSNILSNAYIGLVNPEKPNQLLTTHYVWIDYRHDNTATSGREELLPIPERNFTRWGLMDDRGGHRALESYPLIINSYNYFFDDPKDEHSLVLEGDPYPIGTKLGRVGNGTYDTSTLANYKEGDNIISNNNIAIEVMAADVPVAYTKEIGAQRHFIPGYEYVFALEGTSDEGFGMTSTCDVLYDFRLRIVPDSVYWKGSAESDKEWNKDGNWYFPNGDGTASNTKTFAPLPETNVVIPTGIANYPVLIKGDILPEYIEQTGYLGETETVSTGWNPIELLTFDWEKMSLIDAPTATKYIEFDYNYKANSANEVYFKMGGELARQDLLNYYTAKIDLTLNTLQWYGLSAPLHNMYAGDYMFEKANPLTQMRIHNTTSPQTGAAYTSWTEPFNTTIEKLNAGLGYAVSIGSAFYNKSISDDGISTTDMNNDSNWSIWSTASLTFPQSKNKFNFYDEITKKLMDYSEEIDADLPDGTVGEGRKYGSRFIYEKKLETPETDAYGRPVLTEVPADDEPLVSIAVKTAATDNHMVIGNPLMAHIDFEKFYAANHDLIEPGFKILTGKKGVSYLSIMGTDSSNEGVISDPVTTDPTSNGLTLKSIPPMQSFVLTLKPGAANTDKLLINRDMGVVNVASTLKSTSVDDNNLTISVSDKYDFSTTAVLKVSSDASDTYNPSEDSRRMLIDEVNRVPNVFTVIDGIYLDINRMEQLPQSLPIGILGGRKGAASLSLSGFDSFTTDKDFFLLDTEKDVLLPIEDNTFEYAFEYAGSESIGRFYLITKSQEVGLDNINRGLSIYAKDRIIHVLSVNGSNIDEVSIYGLDGNLLYKRENVGNSHLQIPAANFINQVLIVKAVTDKSTQVEKVINK